MKKRFLSISILLVTILFKQSVSLAEHGFVDTKLCTNGLMYKDSSQSIFEGNIDFLPKSRKKGECLIYVSKFPKDLSIYDHAVNYSDFPHDCELAPEFCRILNEIKNNGSEIDLKKLNGLLASKDINIDTNLVSLEYPYPGFYIVKVTREYNTETYNSTFYNKFGTTLNLELFRSGGFFGESNSYPLPPVPPLNAKKINFNAYLDFIHNIESKNSQEIHSYFRQNSYDNKGRLFYDQYKQSSDVFEYIDNFKLPSPLANQARKSYYIGLVHYNTFGKIKISLHDEGFYQLEDVKNHVLFLGTREEPERNFKLKKVLVEVRVVQPNKEKGYSRDIKIELLPSEHIAK